MPDWLKWESIKDILSNPLLLTILIAACFAALYLPDSFYGGTDAPAFLARNRSWIKLGLAFCVLALAVKLAFSASTAISSFWTRRRRALARMQKETQRQAEREQQRQTVLRHLDTLNADERRVLRYCANVRARTLTIRPSEVVGNSLVDKGLMTMAGGSAFGCPFTIEEFVWDAIKDTPPELAEDDPIRNERNQQTSLSHWIRSLQGNPYL